MFPRRAYGLLHFTLRGRRKLLLTSIVTYLISLLRFSYCMESMTVLLLASALLVHWHMATCIEVRRQYEEERNILCPSIAFASEYGW